MTSEAVEERGRAVAIIRLAEAARIFGVEVNAAAAIRSGASLAAVIEFVWSSIVPGQVRHEPNWLGS